LGEALEHGTEYGVVLLPRVWGMKPDALPDVDEDLLCLLFSSSAFFAHFASECVLHWHFGVQSFLLLSVKQLPVTSMQVDHHGSFFRILCALRAFYPPSP
jgi:hypothetical protein